MFQNATAAPRRAWRPVQDGDPARPRWARPVLLLVLLLVLLGGCASGGAPSAGGAPAATAAGRAGDTGGADRTGVNQGSGGGRVNAGVAGDPIKVGDISSYSGFNIFPEPATAARLVFQRYNEQGGLDGRPVRLVSVDDQDTVEGAASGAKRLLTDEEVVGFCCGGSIVDCTTNAAFYASNGIEVVPAVAACAEAPTVHPTNVGPFLPTLHLLDFFAFELGRERICISGYDNNLVSLFLDNYLPVWEAARGREVGVVIADPGHDLGPAVTKLRDDGCEATVLAFTELGYQAFFETAASQGVLGEIDFAMLTSGYSLRLLDVSGEHLDGVYAASSFEPFTGEASARSSEVQDYLSLMDSVGELATGLGEGGYLAANIMLAALESVEGEITFESVQEAIRTAPYETELLGQPFTATGYGNGIQPNLTTQLVQVEGLDYVLVDDRWRAFSPDTEPGAGPAGASASSG